MKIDFDLIREILLKVEESDSYVFSSSFVSEKYSAEKIDTHMDILIRKNFLIYDKKHYVGNQYPNYEIKSLDLDGLEYLSTIKNEKMWEKIKNIANSKEISLSFKVIGYIFKIVIENLINQTT